MSIITLNTRSLPDSAVTTAKVAADAITDAKIADDVVGTEHLTAGEVDATALGADSVTAAKINNDIISGSTELSSAPADTDEFLVSDAGTLKRLDYSLIKASGSTPAFHAELSSNTTGLSDNSFVKVQCNTEVLDTDSAYDNSSNYRFTPGVSGKYFIYGHVLAKGGSDGCKEVRTAIYKNGSVVSQTTSGNEGEVSTGDLGISNTIGLILDSDDNDYFELYTRIDVASGNSTLVGSNGQTVFGGFKIT